MAESLPPLAPNQEFENETLRILPGIGGTEEERSEPCAPIRSG